MRETVKLRVSQLRLPLGADEAELPQRIARRLRVPRSALLRYRILRRSLDARRPNRISFVYTVEAELVRSARLRPDRLPPGAEPYQPLPFQPPRPGHEPLRSRPVIVGAGPAGLFAAWLLTAMGYPPIVLERGKAVPERVRDVERFESGGPLDPESNYLFGEGGAGTFSDGKLTCRRSGPEVRAVLRVLAAHKGRPEILWEARPHLGSNRLPAVVKALRRRLVAAGAEFRFTCRCEDLDLRDGRVCGVYTTRGRIPTEVVVLAMGHSARDVYAVLQRRGVPLEPKPFQFGARIEQPQEQVNQACYGPAAGHPQLGPAEYELKVHTPRALYTFCMCPGGYVIPSVSEPGFFCTNGMSYARRDSPFANSGLVITVAPDELGERTPLAGIRFQRTSEARAYWAGKRQYLAPIQWAADFLAGRPSRGVVPSSHRRGVVPGDLRDILPPTVVHALLEGLPALDRQLKGALLRDATLVGPEARGSAPVRVPRDSTWFHVPGLAGLYPCGEGAGYAGGIVSAAVDGLRVAAAIVRRYAPLDEPVPEMLAFLTDDTAVLQKTG